VLLIAASIGFPLPRHRGPQIPSLGAASVSSWLSDAAALEATGAVSGRLKMLKWFVTHFGVVLVPDGNTLDF